MYYPSIFGENLFDDFMNDFPMRGFMTPMGGKQDPLFGKHAQNLMKTDVKETEKGYELDIDLPGFKKDEIHLELKDGYLTISAAKSMNKDEKNEEGKYIRQERYTGSCSRSFYLGNAIEPQDIRAKFEDGTLRLNVPKVDPNKVDQTKYIAIEG